MHLKTISNLAHHHDIYQKLTVKTAKARARVVSTAGTFFTVTDVYMYEYVYEYGYGYAACKFEWMQMCKCNILQKKM